MSEGATCFLCVTAALMVFGVIPLGWLGVGWWALRRGSTRKVRALGGVGLGLFGAYLVLWVVALWAVGPWRGGVIAQGRTPDGREFCVVQTYKGLIEPFQVSFYERLPGERWRWHYLDHEDTGWRRADVTIRDNVAHVARNGAAFREIPLGTIAAPLAAEEENSCPASFSISEIVAFHDRTFAGR